MEKFKLVLIVLAIIVCVIVAGLYFVHNAENTAVGMEEEINFATSENCSIRKNRNGKTVNLLTIQTLFGARIVKQ